MNLWKLDNNNYINKDNILSIEGYFISDHGDKAKYCKVKLINNTILNIPLDIVEKEFDLSFDIMDYQSPRYYLL